MENIKTYNDFLNEGKLSNLSKNIKQTITDIVDKYKPEEYLSKKFTELRNKFNQLVMDFGNTKIVDEKLRILNELREVLYGMIGEHSSKTDKKFITLYHKNVKIDPELQKMTKDIYDAGLKDIEHMEASLKKSK